MPWRLVYCLIADPKIPVANPQGNPEEWLGPVKVRLAGAKRAVEETGDVSINELAHVSGEYFYCTAVSVSAPAKFSIEVLDAGEAGKDGAVLFRTPVEVTTAQPCVWHRLVVANGNSESMTANPSAARPRYSGMSPGQWSSDVASDSPLDGIDVDHPLKLSIDWTVADPKLTVTSAEDMIPSAKDHLLARWWVNGAPVVAAPAGKNLAQNGWRISSGKEMAIPFILPKTLGQLKAGDKLTLQLMYTPAGMKQVDAADAKPAQPLFVPRIVAHPATLPRLSDKLEIVVTDEMLK